VSVSQCLLSVLSMSHTFFLVLSSWVLLISAAKPMRIPMTNTAAALDMGSIDQRDPAVGAVGPVVVAGATGRTGMLTYLALRDAGVDVRALVRNASKARELLECGPCGEDEVRHAAMRGSWINFRSWCWPAGIMHAVMLGSHERVPSLRYSFKVILD